MYVACRRGDLSRTRPPRPPNEANPSRKSLCEQNLEHRTTALAGMVISLEFGIETSHRILANKSPVFFFFSFPVHCARGS